MKILFRAALVAAMLLTVGATAVSAAPATVTLARVNYLSFLNHSIGFTTKIADDYDDVVFYSGIYDVDGVAEALRIGRNHASTELKWLKAHKPTSSCFTAVYARYTSEVNYNYLALSDLYTYWHNWPYSSESLYNRGMARLKTATSLTKQVTALLKKTHC